MTFSRGLVHGLLLMIAAPELLAAIRRIESRGALETAHRALANCGQVFRYAVATGRAQRDPSGDLRGALPPVKRDKHFAAITDPQKVGELMRDIDGYQGSFIVKCGFKLSPLLFVRPGELRKMEWADVNLDAAEWVYFVTKTETNNYPPVPSILICGPLSGLVLVYSQLAARFLTQAQVSNVI